MITSPPIQSWTDGYVALRHRAEAVRGAVTIHPNTLDAERWPRTTAADAIAIAALVDPFVRALPATTGHLAIARRWAACLAELEAAALGDQDAPYRHNRALWRTVAAVAVHLASVGCAGPSPIEWEALFAQLAMARPRNAGPKGAVPFGPFTGVKTYDELWSAQYKLLRERHGVDAATKYPLTTNAEVVTLADYWTKQLGAVKRVSGHDRAKAGWDAAITDVNTIAKPADPTAVYPKNNLFWRALETLAIQIATADEAPTDWDRFVDAVGHSVTHLPENLAAAAEYVAGGAGAAASAVSSAAGKVAGAAAGGFLGALKTPLLVGAGLVGAYLLLRNRDDDPRANGEG
jgi:hypothetical protein